MSGAAATIASVHRPLTLKDLESEHVLPRNPKAGTWSAYVGDDRTTYPHRVGNYLLLTQPFNSSLGNIEWPEKRVKIKAVEASQAPLTRSALKMTAWDTKAIDKRSEILAKRAAAHWKS